jgi:phosphoacetylglucosamine mutase
VVETILRAYDWSLTHWEALYTDLPSRQLKVKVKDRYAISVTDGERRVSSPVQLQVAIDTLVAKYNKGRSFAR